MRHTSRTRWTAVLVSAGVVLLLAGCVGTAAPKAGSTHTSTPLSSTPSATPGPPTLDNKGSAQDNLAYFDRVNHAVLASNPSAVGADFINALVAAGFNKADMQLTADKTSVGLPAGSIQFSVRFHGACLVGQNGAGAGGYYSEVTPLLSTGNCLIGDTVPLG
jgi:hypothetical protein